MALKDNSRRLAAGAYPFGATVSTRFGDMDPNRHLNNVAVARLLEEGRIRFHRAMRDAHPELGWPHFLVAHIAIDYLAEGDYPADVDLRIGILAAGTSSFRIAQALFQNDRPFALADCVLVQRATDAPGSAPLPPAYKSALKGYSLA